MAPMTPNPASTSCARRVPRAVQLLLTALLALGLALAPGGLARTAYAGGGDKDSTSDTDKKAEEDAAAAAKAEEEREKREAEERKKAEELEKREAEDRKKREAAQQAPRETATAGTTQEQGTAKSTAPAPAPKPPAKQSATSQGAAAPAADTDQHGKGTAPTVQQPAANKVASASTTPARKASTAKQGKVQKRAVGAGATKAHRKGDASELLLAADVAEKGDQVVPAGADAMDVLALSLVGGDLTAAAKSGKGGSGDKCTTFRFVYRNGLVDEGEFCGGNEVTREDIPTLNAAMLHISCSDDFLPDGTTVKSDLDGLLVATWSITKADGRVCGETYVPVDDITLGVVKTNDADRNSTYTDDELASAPGQDVAFRAVVTNTSTVPVVLDTISDAFGGNSQAVCADLIDDVLAAGASTGRTFTLTGYAPAAGAALVNTVTVTGHQQDFPTNTAQAQDTSQVRSPEPGALAVSVTKTNDADGQGDYTDVEEAPKADRRCPSRPSSRTPVRWRRASPA
jgi:hypothetical protein